MLKKLKINIEILIFISFGVPFLSLFLASLVVARNYSIDQYGQFSTSIAINTIIVGAIGSGIPTYMLRRYSEGKGSRSDRKQAITALLILSGFLIIISMSIAALLYGTTFSCKYVLPGAILFISTNIFFLNQFNFVASKNNFRVALSNLIAGVLIVLFAEIAAVLSLSIGSCLYAMAIGYNAATFFVINNQTFSAESSRGKIQYKSIATLSMMALTVMIYTNLPIVIISYFNSNYEASILAIGQRFMGSFDFIGSAFSVIYLSKLGNTRNNPRESKKVRDSHRKFLLFIVVVVVVLIILLSNAIILLLFGIRYIDAVTPMRILALSSIPMALYLPTKIEFMAHDKEITVFKISLYCLIFSIAIYLAIRNSITPTIAAMAFLVLQLSTFATYTIANRNGASKHS